MIRIRHKADPMKTRSSPFKVHYELEIVQMTRRADIKSKIRIGRALKSSLLGDWRRPSSFTTPGVSRSVHLGTEQSGGGKRPRPTNKTKQPNCIGVFEFFGAQIRYSAVGETQR